MLDPTITITCPKCSHKISKPASWFKRNPKCPGCGKVSFNGTKLNAGLRDVEKKITDTIAKINRSFKR